MIRKEKFVGGEIYHICNKSIANVGIFKDPENAKRFMKTVGYYNVKPNSKRLSHALMDKTFKIPNLLLPQENSIVKTICYCIMPDHYHLLLKLREGSDLSKYIGDVENSFSRYFNLRFNRKGPLWQSRFRAVRIKTEEQLLHVSRYIHLNPTTAELIKRPEDWPYSSYRDYIYSEKILKTIMIEIPTKNPVTYKKFCEDRIDYQKKLRKIKKLLLD